MDAPPPEPRSGIEPLHRLHAGQTIYVIGSGDQLNHLNPADYRDQVTVAVNQVPLRWQLKPTYTLTKYHPVARQLLNAGHRVICAQAHEGVYAHTHLHDNFADTPPHQLSTFRHKDMIPGLGLAADLTHWSAKAEWPTHPHWLIVGPTVTMTALHFACYLGASKIIELGIGGTTHVSGYYHDEQAKAQRGWLDQIRAPLEDVRQQLRQRYPVEFT